MQWEEQEIESSILERGKHFFKKQSPARLFVLGFMLVIIIGAGLLMLPVSLIGGGGLHFLDALFTSTSAVCVTGLVVVDPGDTFTVFGRTVIAFLIQIGGLGVTCVGVGIVLAAGKKVGFKSRQLVKEAMNVGNFKGLVRLVKYVLIMTLCFESVGAILSFFVFVQDYPPLSALGFSVFHAIASFNNAGFDIFGGMVNMIPYQTNYFLNIVTAALIFFGGIGFLVILDVMKNRSFRKLRLHSKAVISTSIALIIVGTVLLKATEDITWLGAFFQSVSARTAGFASYPIGSFSSAGLFVIVILMFIGASPGSTGGGIKTSTFFVLINAVKSVSTNQHCLAFKRKIPQAVMHRAFVITLLSFMVVCVSTFALSLLEPDCTFMQLLFETTSAFGTVGLSTGITPALCEASKAIVILTMFVGRLGPLTIATIWIFKPTASAVYTEENITIG